MSFPPWITLLTASNAATPIKSDNFINIVVLAQTRDVQRKLLSLESPTGTRLKISRTCHGVAFLNFKPHIHREDKRNTFTITKTTKHEFSQKHFFGLGHDDVHRNSSPPHRESLGYRSCCERPKSERKEAPKPCFDDRGYC